MRRKKRTLKPRAIVFLVALLVAVGGVIYDQRTQRGTTGPETQALYTEGAVHNEYEAEGERGPAAGPGTGTSETGMGLPQEEAPGSAGTDRGPYPNEPTKYTNLEGREEKSSYALLGPGGAAGGSVGLDNVISRGNPGAAYLLNSNAGSRSGNLFDEIGDEFKITAYTAGFESCGKHPDDPAYGITYSGKKVQENHTIAADLKILPLGTKVLIEGIDAVFVVEDKGSAVRGKHIDVYMPDLSEALDWGVQYRRIIILEIGGADNGK